MDHPNRVRSGTIHKGSRHQYVDFHYRALVLFALIQACCFSNKHATEKSTTLFFCFFMIRLFKLVTIYNYRRGERERGNTVEDGQIRKLNNLAQLGRWESIGKSSSFIFKQAGMFMDPVSDFLSRGEQPEFSTCIRDSMVFVLNDAKAT